MPADITKESVAEFRGQGYVVIPGVLDDAQLRRGRDLAAAMLAQEPPPPGHAGPYFLWPRLGGGHALLDFYARTGIGRLATGLLRADLGVTDPDFAQLATTIPPWPHRPGGPHVDGLTPGEPDGRPGTFSLLAGVWLTGQREPRAATQRRARWPSSSRPGCRRRSRPLSGTSSHSRMTLRLPSGELGQLSRVTWAPA